MRLALACAGEVVGTYILVGIGTAAVAIAVLTDVGLDGWGVAAAWGAALAIATRRAEPCSHQAVEHDGIELLDRHHNRIGV